MRNVRLKSICQSQYTHLSQMFEEAMVGIEAILGRLDVLRCKICVFRSAYFPELYFIP
jgi:hypothetical protein